MSITTLFAGSPYKVATGLANSARNRKDWATALTHYKVAIGIRPQQVNLLVQAGNMSKELGDYDQAERFYHSATLASGLDDVYLQLGHLEKLRGRLPAALFYYTKARELNPKNVAAEAEYTAAMREPS